jgi:hypothetical protein
VDLGRVGIVVRGEDLQGPQPVSDVNQGHRLELAAPADGFLGESDRLFGRLPGGPEVLRSIEVQVPDPGPNQVTIDVRAAAMNPPTPSTSHQARIPRCSRCLWGTRWPAW